MLKQPELDPQRLPLGGGFPYRPDIDGLRAVAVLLVILYHFGIGPFRGGFVGVDVFFVVSGFLISGLIQNQMKTGTFSFSKFYSRRFKRLIPALVTVVGISMIMGAFIFSGELYLNHARLALAAVFSFANLSLWHQVSYFDTDAHLKPLLHTWFDLLQYKL